jgi:ribosome recycling factor
VPEPQLLAIRPYGQPIKGIERAILASELGQTPNNDGKLIRLHPRLTQERRVELVKIVKKRVEEAHVSVHNPAATMFVSAILKRKSITE